VNVIVHVVCVCGGYLPEVSADFDLTEAPPGDFEGIAITILVLLPERTGTVRPSAINAVNVLGALPTGDIGDDLGLVRATHADDADDSGSILRGCHSFFLHFFVGVYGLVAHIELTLKITF